MIYKQDRKLVITGFAIALCLWMVPNLRADTSGPKVLVVKSRNVDFYLPTVNALIKGLGRRGYGENNGTVVDVISLTGNSGKDFDTVKSSLKKRPNIIVTLGTDATLDLNSEKTDVPIVFSMILDPISLGLLDNLDHPGGDITGTTILVDPGKQFDALLQTAPRVKRIGVLFSPQDKTSQDLITQAKDESQRIGLAIFAVPLADPKTGLEAALDSMKGNVDAVWLIPDPASSGSLALSATLDFAKINSLPVLGSSSATAKAGAVISLAADLGDLGDVTADMASSILDGNVKAGDLRVRGPRQTTLTLNLVSAQQLRLTVPDSVLHLADEVIDGKQ